MRMLAASAIAALLVASSANATLFRYTITGSVEPFSLIGYDDPLLRIALGGVTGTNTYRIDAVVDDAAPDLNPSATAGRFAFHSFSFSLNGGTALDVPSSGTQLLINGSANGGIDTTINIQGNFTRNIAGFPGDEEVGASLFFTLPGHPIAPGAPFTVSPLANVVSGNVGFSAKDAKHEHFFALSSNASRTLSPVFDSFTVTEVTGTPEPTSWALFIGGFGLIGIAMRRQKAKVRCA